MNIKRRVRRAYEVIGARKLHESARFVSAFTRFQRMSKQSVHQRRVLWRDRYPCLNDRTAYTTFDSHYVYHPAWAARVLVQIRPEYHVDISSTVNFCSILSAFVPVAFYDYRPAKLNLSGLDVGAADLLNLPFADGSIVSISCMHVVEHIGLGRYGDLLDPDGDLKAIAELKRVLAPGGSLLFATPVGRPRVMFNAHRIYSFEQVDQAFTGLELQEFSLIPDNGQEIGIISNAAPALVEEQDYGCGCFWFKRGQL